MRFIEDGPDIPDELLWALDEGKVVFFCGAGVSQATGRLPNFVGLAEDLLEKFHVPEEGRTFKLLRKDIPELEKSHEPGLVSIDHIFSYLETEFDGNLVQQEVARSLKPVNKLTKPHGCKEKLAHEILLDLASAGGGNTRLVTTNFDLLFQQVRQPENKKMKSWVGPNLPQLHKGQVLDGLVYLHGRCTPEYDGPEPGGFILSKEGFGRAYLSEAWATNFLKVLFDRFVIVFVGYSANDPPIAYLLQGLRNKVNLKNRAYAFQEGISLSAQWRAKGITPIPYLNEPDDLHRKLWMTLEAWSNKAKSTEEWFKSIFKNMLRGPGDMLPHERGQVAHVVSTAKGVEWLLNLSKKAIKDRADQSDLIKRNLAEWLCVFDKKIRFAPPYKWEEYENNSVRSREEDGFSRYALDGEVIKDHEDQRIRLVKRPIPRDAWDIFSLNDRELERVLLAPYPNAQRTQTEVIANLGKRSRINKLYEWIGLIYSDPLVIWWASRLDPANHKLLISFFYGKAYSRDQLKIEVFRQWEILRFFYEYISNENPPRNCKSYMEFLDLKEIRDKWDVLLINRCLKLPLEITSSNRAPWCIKEVSHTFSLSLNYDFNHPLQHICTKLINYEWNQTNDELLELIVSHLIYQFQTAMLNGGSEIVSQLSKGKLIDNNRINNTFDCEETFEDFTSLLTVLAQLLDQYALYNTPRVFSIIYSLPLKQYDPFHRIVVWALGNEHIVSNDNFLLLFRTLSNDAIWTISDHKDLLCAIKLRWENFDEDIKESVEHIFLDDLDKYHEGEILRALSCLESLNQDKQRFSEDTYKKIKEIAVSTPGWMEQRASRGCSPSEEFDDVVDPDYNPLLDTPAQRVILCSRQLYETPPPVVTPYTDFFRGLCNKDPLHAFNSLKSAPSSIGFPTDEWRTYLVALSNMNQVDQGLCVKTAELLLSISNGELCALSKAYTQWISSFCEKLIEDTDSDQHAVTACLTLQNQLIEKFIGVLRAMYAQSQPSDRANNIRDAKKLHDIALNSLAGRCARALIAITKVAKASVDCQMTSLQHIEKLLSLGGAVKAETLSIVFADICHLYYEHGQWAGINLLGEISSKNQEMKDAVRSGLYYQLAEVVVGINNHFRDKENLKAWKMLQLYRRCKDFILSWAYDTKGMSIDSLNYLSQRLYDFWLTRSPSGFRAITDKQFRDILLRTSDELRSHFVMTIDRQFSEECDKAGMSMQAVQRLKDFLEMYPLALSAHTPKASLKLLYLTIRCGERFKDIGQLVLDRIGEIQPDTWVLHFNKYPGAAKLAAIEPNLLMNILDKCLPKDPFEWPLEMKKLIEVHILKNEQLCKAAKDKAFSRIDTWY